MKLVVGLGNPGSKYENNRHNIGFLVLDRIAQDHGFGPWRAKFQGMVSEGRLGDARITLLKPETYMNNSGQSVGEAARYLKVAADDIIVLHDELDLAPGKLRLKKAGGHAGHNGLRSLHQHIGENYRRLRIGVGHPGHKDRVAGYVLSDFAKSEQTMIDDMIRAISKAAPALVQGTDAAFMNAVGAQMSPPRNSGKQRPDPVLDNVRPAERADPPKTPPATISQASEPSFVDRLRALGERFK